MTITQKLQAIVGTKCLENEPMSKHTNFRIGGPAKWFVEVRSVEELQNVLDVARENELATFVFGGGSNLLASDQGFDGIVIKIAMRTYDIQGTRVRADAGVLSSGLARATANAGLKGLTWAISLPGTVGGGVRGNAGCFGGETRDHLVEAFVLSNGEVVSRTNAELAFGYRESAIKHSLDIVLSATFELKSGDQSIIKQIMESNLAKRKASQPLDAGSAGCMFKNYDATEEDLQRLAKEYDVLPPEMLASRRVSAGWLIDKLGLKGTKIGNAQISPEHGNFIVNLGGATASDVAQIVALVKTRARNQVGIQLQEEVQYLGF